MVADPVSGLVEIALRQPNRLVLVDGRSGTVTRTVAVPGAARHLQLPHQEDRCSWRARTPTWWPGGPARRGGGVADQCRATAP